MPETSEHLLTAIRTLAPEITARAAEIETVRRIPPDLVDKLRSTGFFRIFVPPSHAGLGLDLPSALDVIAALSRIDGSVGWAVMIGCGASLFASLLPRDIYEQVYQDGPDVTFAGSAQPAGTAEAVSGGWRVNGRWPFASGCQHADWMLGVCVMAEGGTPLPGSAGEGGPPMIRGFLLPAHHWQIEDTWHVAGLKGTGSHHITLEDIFVPAGNFFDLVGGASCLKGPLYQAPRQVLPLLHGANSLGMAEGALDALVALANTGRQQFAAPQKMRDSETFQGALGGVAAVVRAARAFLEIQAASHWRRALAGTLNDEALYIQNAQTAAWLATTCVGVADRCFALGGASALYESSPLQRRMRDLHAAAQHAVAHERHYIDAGKLLLNAANCGAPAR
ncbi:MAG TPA: acyl-CoA dehydrogenase family protein [Acetobacteraceae bacterium]|nr:acyl-CoA dehydrogenase family protein [Acetobacteraceae bacterium]